MKFFLISFLMSFTIYAQTTVLNTSVSGSQKRLSFKASDGKFRFVATGRPAMIKIQGEGTGPYGDLILLDNKLNGSLVVDLKNISTHIDLRDEHLKSKYLEVEKYPVATITIKDLSVKLDDINSIETKFISDFNLHGTTKVVNGTIRISKNNDVYYGHANFKLKISDYLSSIPSYAGIKIADEVEVLVDIKTIPQ